MSPLSYRSQNTFSTLSLRSYTVVFLLYEQIDVVMCSCFPAYKCIDTPTADRRNLGTLETPTNNYNGAYGLTSAIGVGLFYDEDRMDQWEIDRLGAEAVALTHGGPTAFLSGAVLTHIMSKLLRKPNAPLKKVVMEAVEAMKEQFGHQYSQAFEIATLLRHAITYSETHGVRPVEIMEKLSCDSAAQVLAGAIYACLVSGNDFDRAMIVSVNHSGRSSAVGAITGAILGIRMGEEALPDFYMECLEPVEILREPSNTSKKSFVIPSARVFNSLK